MKKLFFFAALFAATMVNAEVVFDATTLTNSDYTLSDLIENSETDAAKGKYVYNGGIGSSATVGDVKFFYNKGDKSKLITIQDSAYIRTGASPFFIQLSNVTVGHYIALTVRTKGNDKGVHFAIKNLEKDYLGEAGAAQVGWEKLSEDAVSGIDTPLPSKNEYKAQLGDSYEECPWVTIVVKATDSDVVFAETYGGFDIQRIEITENIPSALNNVAAETVKATKVMENGQIYIIKNGVKFNVLGAQVAE